MQKKKILLIILGFFQISTIIAQERTITGQITSDADGMTLPGVNVLVKGTNIGAVTHMDGNYSLQAPENATLVFSSLGFVTIEVAVAGKTVINLSMEEDLESLSEVVVTAFGIQRKKNILPYAAQQISGEDVNKTKIGNVASCLLYTSDAADDLLCVDLGGRRIIKK